LAGEVFSPAEGDNLFDQLHSQADQLPDLPEANDAGDVMGSARPAASVRATRAEQLHFDQELIA